MTIVRFSARRSTRASSTVRRSSSRTRSAEPRRALSLGLQKSGIKFLAADMPEANELVVGVMALVAQAERKMISTRTREALAAAKVRGVKLGNPRAPRHSEAEPAGEKASRHERRTPGRGPSGCAAFSPSSSARHPEATGLARALNERQVSTPRGGKWSARTVLDVLKRLPGHSSVSHRETRWHWPLTPGGRSGAP